MDTLKHLTEDEPGIDVTFALQPWHLEQFEIAREYIEKIYGKAPPAKNLMHLCLCKASWEIVGAFKTALDQIAASGFLDPNGPDAEVLTM